MKDKKTFFRLAGYLKKYRILFAAVLIMTVIGTVLAVLAPAVTGQITSLLFDGAKDGSFAWNRIFSLLLTLVLLYLGGQAVSVLREFGMARITSGVMQKLRNDIDDKMHRMTIRDYDSAENGEILSVITNDVEMVSGAFSSQMTELLSEVIEAVGILIMMLNVNAWMTLIAAALVPVTILAAEGQIRAGTENYTQQLKDLSNLNGCIEEMYNGHSVVQTFNYEGRARKKFRRLNLAMQESAQKADTASGMVSPITSFVNSIGFALSALTGCLLALAGKISIGNVQAMLIYTSEFSEPFTGIAGMAGSFSAAMASARRIFNLLDAEEETPDPENPSVPAGHAGSVEFRHVSFGYQADQPLMRDVNLAVKPGQQIAIVGPTGAGKTTLVNLLMRFYEIDGGEIIVDGVNTKKMSRDELCSRFGMVLQDTWLFAGTIEENLAFARDDLSHDQVLAASEAACADGFIRTFPGQYQMKLTHGGENISSGERQLLTIARAMAADPEIMILDEATSNVDTETEMKIQKAMNRLLKGRTSFVIAHRLSTIRHADKILYMENGDIRETGSHEELMKLNGKYAALYNSQFE
jgi:ABC-type multidrug transport system fused ATPase/permease subunit